MREWLTNNFGNSVTPVGSRVTCEPPPIDTDADYLILGTVSKVDEQVNLLITEGFQLDNPSTHYRPEENLFNSWRKGETNVILTFDPQFYRRFLAATSVAKHLNLMVKDDRVILFQAVLYGNT